MTDAAPSARLRSRWIAGGVCWTDPRSAETPQSTPLTPAHPERLPGLLIPLT
ncbi:MAG: hypothetical protein RBS27_16015 [Giesbergeria sp.]|nr:hypothetical protein [Giesbergeria sp.]